MYNPKKFLIVFWFGYVPIRRYMPHFSINTPLGFTYFTLTLLALNFGNKKLIECDESNHIPIEHGPRFNRTSPKIPTEFLP